jgi:transposase
MLVTMSDKELVRAQVIQSVCEKRLRRRDAASQLDLSERQVQRLMDKFRLSGTPGLASLNRGKPGNNNLPEQLRMNVLALLRENYSDFGPTLATEKLSEHHQISISVETVRHWMIADGLWASAVCDVNYFCRFLASR